MKDDKVATIVYIILLPVAIGALVIAFAVQDDVLKEKIHTNPTLEEFVSEIAPSDGIFTCNCGKDSMRLVDFNPWLRDVDAVFKNNKDELCQDFYGHHRLLKDFMNDRHDDAEWDAYKAKNPGHIGCDAGIRNLSSFLNCRDSPTAKCASKGCEMIADLPETAKAVLPICDLGKNLLHKLLDVIQMKRLVSPRLMTELDLETEVAAVIQEASGTARTAFTVASRLDQLTSTNLARRGFFWQCTVLCTQANRYN